MMSTVLFTRSARRWRSQLVRPRLTMSEMRTISRPKLNRQWWHSCAFCLATMVGAVRPIGWLSCNAFQLVDAVRDVLGPVKQLVMSRVRRIAKLSVLAGRTLSADRLEI